MKKEFKNSRQTHEKRILSPEAKKTAISLIINSLLLLAVYFIAMDIYIVGTIVTAVYWLAFGGFLIVYIAYNRAFSRKGVTLEMLPDTWSDEQKNEYIEDGVRRAKKSKWMLTVIFPLLVTIIADALYLFVWHGFLENYF